MIWRSSRPSVKAGFLRAGCFDYLQINRLHILSGQPVPKFNHPQRRFSSIQIETSFSLCLLFLIPFLKKIITVTMVGNI